MDVDFTTDLTRRLFLGRVQHFVGQLAGTLLFNCGYNVIQRPVAKQ